MDIKLLKKLGLTPSQAKTYLALIKTGKLTPPQLAREIKESRTTAYMSLAKLEEIGLAKQVKDVRKQTYEPVSPSALNQYIEKQRRELTNVEEEYQEGVSDMLSYYYSHRGEPGVRYFQGEEGLREIYQEHLKTGEDVYFVRTPADEKYFGKLLYEYMGQRAKRGITAHGLAPFDKQSFDWAKQHDRELKRKMSWFPAESYTAPVEVAIYGDKTSIISFGEEDVGVIIESPQISQALKQLFAIAKVGAKELMKE